MTRSAIVSGALMSAFLLCSAMPEGTCEGEFKEGATFTWTNHNTGEDAASHTEFVVRSVKLIPDGYVASIEATLRGSDGMAQPPVTAEWECKQGTFTMDTRHFIMMDGESKSSGGKVEKSYSGDPLIYPMGIKVGDTLANASVTEISKMKVAGPVQSQTLLLYAMTVTWKERICDSIQSVTTPAGTWTCYRIKYKSQTIIKDQEVKMVIFTMDCIEWYSPKVGIVRTEVYKEGKMESYRELTKFNASK